MAPTLFNLYAAVVAEKWTEEVQDVEDMGVDLLYKLDQQLVRRSTRGASEVTVEKGEQPPLEKQLKAVGRAYVGVTRALGLTVSLAKTKFMVVGRDAEKPLPGRVEMLETAVEVGDAQQDVGELEEAVELLRSLEGKVG